MKNKLNIIVPLLVLCIFYSAKADLLDTEKNGTIFITPDSIYYKNDSNEFKTQIYDGSKDQESISKEILKSILIMKKVENYTIITL